MQVDEFFDGPKEEAKEKVRTSGRVVILFTTKINIYNLPILAAIEFHRGGKLTFLIESLS